MKPRAFNTLLRSTPQGQLGAKFTASSTLPDKTKNPYLYEVAVLVNEMTNFDARSVWNGLLTPIQQQGQCGACYSYAACSALGDRFAIMTMGQIKTELNPLAVAVCMMVNNQDVQNDDPNTVSNETILTLAQQQQIYSNSGELKAYMDTQQNLACGGDTLFNIARNLYIFGAPSVACVPYDDFDTDTPSMANCLEVSGDKLIGCAAGAPDKYRVPFRARHYAAIDPAQGLEKTILQAKIDIFKFGPIISGFMVYNSFYNTNGKDVYRPTEAERKGKSMGGHAIKVVGWGTQNGEEYWLCANSWGVGWGDQGYFKLAMRDPSMQLEDNFMCIYPDFYSDYGSYDFYNLKNFFVESVEDRAAKYEMMPAVDPYYFVFAEDLSKIAQSKEQDAKYLSAPKLKYYQLPNYQKFMAGDRGTWVNLLGDKYEPKLTAAFAGEDGFSSSSVMWIVGGVGAILVIVYLVYKYSKGVSGASRPAPSGAGYYPM